MPSMLPVGDASPAPPEAVVTWADLPHELLVRIFASQPEPLHNLGAECTCRAWSRAVSAQTVATSKTPNRRGRVARGWRLTHNYRTPLGA